MIDTKKLEEDILNFKVESIKANNSDTLEESIEHLKKARFHIKEIEEMVPEMKQIEHDLTQDLYNKFRPEKHYVKKIKFT